MWQSNWPNWMLWPRNKSKISWEKYRIHGIPYTSIDPVFEARLMRDFNHPNVTRLYGVAATQEPLMLVMELVRKTDLPYSYRTLIRLIMELSIHICKRMSAILRRRWRCALRYTVVPWVRLIIDCSRHGESSIYTRRIVSIEISPPGIVCMEMER